MMDDSIRSALITVIQSKRKLLGRAQRRRGIKPQRWLYPWATENRYAALIRAWLRPMKVYVAQYLKENQDAILRGDSASLRVDSIAAVRLDAVPGKSFKVMVNSLNGWLAQYVPDDEQDKSGSPIFLGLGQIADSAFDFNESQYEKGAKSVLGIEFPVGEDWWPDARETWQDNNYKLIKSDMQKYISQINDLTEKAVTSGQSMKSLAAGIQKLDSQITKGRANFIARDQIGKLNGQITQQRMETVGLSMYIWETAGDEHVRSTHAPLDGKLCRWDDSTVYSEDGGKTWESRPATWCQLHPGADYQCRCTAIAYWEELVGEADANLEVIEKTTALTIPSSTVIMNTKQPEKAKPQKRITELVEKVQTEKEATELGNLLLNQSETEKRDIFSVISDYRKLGSAQKHSFSKGSIKAGMQRIEDAMKYYPRDWVNLSVKSAKSIGLLVKKVQRGYYTQYGTPTVALSPRDGCELHELAHRMEHLNPQILKLEKEFYDRRTAGESLVPLRKQLGYQGAGKNEVVRLDKFANPYMGKDYGGTAYELFSMGVENLKDRRYNTDSDYDAFIVGILAGVK